MTEDVGSGLKRWEGAGPFWGADGVERAKGASESSESDDSLSSVITAKAADGTNGVAVARKRWPERVTPWAGSWTATPGIVSSVPRVGRVGGRGCAGSVRDVDEVSGPNGV